MANRSSQLAPEVFSDPASNARATQIVPEVFGDVVSSDRASQVVPEVFADILSADLASQLAIEVFVRGWPSPPQTCGDAPPPVIPKILPFLYIPQGAGQSVDELSGSSSISEHEVYAIDPTGDLKAMLADPNNHLLGTEALLQLGFPGMALLDFTTLATLMVVKAGTKNDGRVYYNLHDLQRSMKYYIWTNGGPALFAAPWQADTAYAVGEIVQDSNGFIEQCVLSGTSASLAPIWPGTAAPRWQKNTTYAVNNLILDSNGNIQAMTTGSGPSGATEPTWGVTVGSTTTDNGITWKCVALLAAPGDITTETTGVEWELIDLNPLDYVTLGQAPSQPRGTSSAANSLPVSDNNPRYLAGNPMDLLLVALQNELGVGQSNPADPTSWIIYTPGNDASLINPNPYLDVPTILALRDGQFSGDWMEFTIKSQETGKDWIESQILKPLCLYTVAFSSGMLTLKSMKTPPSTSPAAWSDNWIKGIPEIDRWPVLNVVQARMNTDDSSFTTSSRTFKAEIRFQEDASVAEFQQQLLQSIELNGLRTRRGGMSRALLYSDRVFRRHAFGTPIYAAALQLRALQTELGEFVLFTHRLVPDLKGTGARGIASVLCEVIDRQPNYADAEMNYKLLDTRFVQPTKAFEFAADGTPAWTGSSPTQKATYLYITDDSGKMSDGSVGNTIF